MTAVTNTYIWRAKVLFITNLKSNPKLKKNNTKLKKNYTWGFPAVYFGLITNEIKWVNMQHKPSKDSIR